MNEKTDSKPAFPSKEVAKIATKAREEGYVCDEDFEDAVQYCFQFYNHIGDLAEKLVTALNPLVNITNTPIKPAVAEKGLNALPYFYQSEIFNQIQVLESRRKKLVDSLDVRRDFADIFRIRKDQEKKVACPPTKTEIPSTPRRLKKAEYELAREKIYQSVLITEKYGELTFSEATKKYKEIRSTERSECGKETYKSNECNLMIALLKATPMGGRKVDKGLTAVRLFGNISIKGDHTYHLTMLYHNLLRGAKSVPEAEIVSEKGEDSCLG